MDGLPLHTPRLALRPFVPSDSGRVLEMSQERGMREWIPDQVFGDEAQALQVIGHLAAQVERGARPDEAPVVLGVCLRASGELVGHVGLSPWKGAAEVGYAIAQVHQGQGLASEAVAAASRWGLARFGLERILGIVSAENVASCRVLERAGYTLLREEEGVLHGRRGAVRTYAFPAPREGDEREQYPESDGL